MRFGTADGPVEALLCDADGCLFPSEEPAFDASATVTNSFLAELGASRRFTGEELRLATTGKNFRTTAVALAAEAGHSVDAETLERWVELERRAVTAHLAEVLKPDPLVIESLTRLAAAHPVAVVSSSAATRIDACLEATGLARLFPVAHRFSAESSLPVPAGKPDPAVYLHAIRRLGVNPQRAIAIEDSVPGALAALGADCLTAGNLLFVPAAERPRRKAELESAGVDEVITSWQDLECLLESSGAPAEPGRPMRERGSRATCRCVGLAI
jgi:HAD superfamily hydrolase (TIGR01509 family)